ncbi:MAG: transglutaminase family protein, partial [Promethearchaeota archaeon]
MSAAVTTDDRRMGFTTVVSSLILVAMIVWALYSFVLVQFVGVRDYDPHTSYDDAIEWDYDIPWAGGQSSWFDNINYTDVPMNMSLPDDLLDQMENTLFYVAPEDPPQLWRNTAYDSYDGASWTKSDTTQWALGEIDPLFATNPIYRVFLNVTPGPSASNIEIPSLFPDAMIIQGSFETGELVGGVYQPHSPSRLQSYNLYTDEYGTALLSPFFIGDPDQSILLSYEVTYTDQNLLDIATRALNGDQAPPQIQSMYSTLSGVTLTQRVIDNASVFLGAGNAYQTAMVVDNYFRSGIFELMLDDYNDRPPPGQEVTDWFLERGGGLPMDFATAYCVFMRYLGIPARVTLGYAVGDPMGGYREIKVRHMMFWAEVFVPMTGHPEGGEWIQVLPIPLPGSMGGGEDPVNMGSGNAQLWVWPNLSPAWVQIGTPFVLSALLMVDYVPISTPEFISFYDVTDSVDMGTRQIQPGILLPLANLTYVFPSGSTVGPHNITATYSTAGFTVANWTIVSAASTPIPMVASSEPEKTFFASETIDIDIKQGLDTHSAHWNDTLDIRGNMTDSEGQPVDGTTLNNPWMQIMWDNDQIGSALIQANGSYRYLLYIDGSNSTLMSLMDPGAHELWSSYAGEYDPGTGLPIYLPARSSDNSTVTVYGLATSYLTVSPNPAWRGATLNYQGVLQLFDGTILPFESVDIYFNGTYLTTRVTNGFGFFSYDHPIASDHDLGWANAYINWTSTIPGVSDSSDVVPVEIRRRPVDMSNMDGTWWWKPSPIHIWENITIYGWLLDGTNGTGLPGKIVDFWWDNGTAPVHIGSNTTLAAGYYEFTYTVPAGYEGFVDYWVTFTSMDMYYDDSQSPVRQVEVKKWDVDITIFSDPDPVYLGWTLTIQGIVSLPEIAWPVQNAPVTIWWHNSTGLFNLTTVLTNSTGGYIYYHQIPRSHEYDTNATLYATTPTYPHVHGGESWHLYPFILQPSTYLSVYSDGSVFHLNETVYIYGELLDEFGSPIPGENVTIYWSNNTGTYSYVRTTNVTGYYELFNPLSLNHDEGIVDVWAYFPETGPYAEASAILVPSLRLQKFQTFFTINPINGTYHLDEVMYYSGTLRFSHNLSPIPGANVTIYYQNTTGTYPYSKITDATGGFSFQYNFSLSDLPGPISIWCEYISTDPLWSDAFSFSQGATLILYQLELNLAIQPSVYLDQGLLIEGWLTYLGGVPPLVGEPVDIFRSGSPVGPWTHLASRPTDGTGYFSYTHYFAVPPDSEGFYYFKCNYTSTSPYNDNIESGILQVDAQRYPIWMDVFLAPNPVYQNETVTVQAHLYFSHNGTDLASATIELYWFNGTTHRLDDIPLITDATGWVSFPYSSMDEDTVRFGIEVYGVYDGTPFIANFESNHEVLQLDQWLTTISGFDAGLPSYYILQTAPISGTLTYVVGPDPIGGATIQILVDGSPVDTTVTALDGTFIYYWTIPETTSPGFHDISAQYISPLNWVADYTTPPITVDIQRYIVDLTASPDAYTVYRGGSLTISGNLRFLNGTAMDGYQVEIHWDNGTDWVVQTITITDALAGSFNYVLNIGWAHRADMNQYYVMFVRPNLAFEPASTPPEAIEVRGQVVLHLDAQTVFSVRRGDSFTLSGYGLFGGIPMPFVPIQILADSNPIDSTVTGPDGTFSIDIQVPPTFPKGTYNISLQVDPIGFFDAAGLSDYWWVQVPIDTIVTVTLPQSYEVMPGETIWVDIAIEDVDNNPVNDTDVSIFLGENHIADRYIPGISAGFSLAIPTDWTGVGSGIHPITVRFPGDGPRNLLASSGDSIYTVHYIAEVVFDFGGTPAQVTNGTDFVISVILTDEVGNPIRYRDVNLLVNRTWVYAE